MLFAAIFATFVIVVFSAYGLGFAINAANQADDTSSIIGYTFTFLFSMVATYLVINIWRIFFSKIIK